MYQGQVDGQISRLAANIEIASKEFEELASRLGLVSRVQPPPAAGKDGPSAVENLCPLAEAIRQSNEQLELLKERIAEMLNLLEI